MRVTPWAFRKRKPRGNGRVDAEPVVVGVDAEEGVKMSLTNWLRPLDRLNEWIFSWCTRRALKDAESGDPEYALRILDECRKRPYLNRWIRYRTIQELEKAIVQIATRRNP